MGFQLCTGKLHEPCQRCQEIFPQHDRTSLYRPITTKDAQWSFIYRKTFFQGEIQTLERAARSQSHAEEGLGDILKRPPRVRRRL
jgi:hypothetical protein